MHADEGTAKKGVEAGARVGADAAVTPWHLSAG